MGKVGGPRVFFDVLGAFNAHRLLKDSKAQMAVVESIVLDSVDSIMQSLGGFGTVIDRLTQSTIGVGLAVGTAIVEFEKFAGDNKELQAEIIATGESFGFTADEALSAGAKMAQLSAIFGETTTAAATQLGQQFALISGMGTQEAMTGLINLQQQTQFMYGGLTQAQYRLLDAQDQRNTAVLQSTEFLDEMNTVENKSAATMKQMIFVMNQFAAQAHTTGESIANMAAMSATLIEAGEEQGKAGRALRMIYARLGSNIQENNDVLEKYGVAAKDANGAVRPLSNILHDLAEVYPDLNAEAKQNIAQTVAGNDHYVRFTKLIENYARFNELATDAVENQSTAQAELNRVLKSNTMDYKRAQATLENYKAEIGQGLLPTMTSVTNMQSRLISGFLEFEGIGGMKLLGMIIKLREYSRILGGVFDMYLQMKSVNISMAVHETILKAIAGQEIVRTDNYRKQGIFSGITTSNQKELALITNQLAVKESELRVLKLSNATTDEKRNMVQKEYQSQLALSEKHQRKLQEIGEHRLYIMRMMISAYQEELTYGEKYTQNAQIQGRFSQMATDAEYEKMRAAQKVLLVKQSQIAAIKQEIDLETALLATDNRRTNLTKLQEQQQLRLNIALAAAGFTTHDLSEVEQKRLRILSAQIVQEDALRAAQTARMSAQDMLNTLTQEQINNLAALGASMDMLLTLDAIHIQEIIKELPLLEARNNLLREQAIEQLKANIETYKATAAGRTLNTEVQRLNMSYSRFSMAAGMASMALGIFGDEADSAQASIMLMMLSMAPAIMQMSEMSVGLMNGAHASRLAAEGVTAFKLSMQGLMNTLKLAVPLAVGAMIFATLINRSKEAKDSIADLNDTLKVSQNLLIAMTESQAAEFKVPQSIQDNFFLNETIDLTKAGLYELAMAQDVATDKIKDFRDAQVMLAEDDPLYGILQNDINELQTFINTIGQVKLANLGEGFVNTGDFQTDLDTMIRMNKEGLLQMNQDTGIIFSKRKIILDNALPGDPLYYGSEVVYKGTIGETKTAEAFLKNVESGVLTMEDLTEEGRKYFEGYIEAMDLAGTYSFRQQSDSINEMGEEFTVAEDKMRAFANAREELFFGGKSSYMSGDMMKQVVNKGVENLYSNVELIMTNNFYGLTFEQAIDTISDSVVGRLVAAGVPMNKGV